MLTEKEIENYRKDRDVLHYLIKGMDDLANIAKDYEEKGVEAFGRKDMIVFIEAFVRAARERSSQTTSV